MRKRALYIIMFGEHEFFKVGMSFDAKARAKSLQTAAPKKITLIAEIPCPYFHAEGLERAVHRRIQKYRACGEWFAISLDKLVTEIEDVIKIYSTSKFRKYYDEKMQRVQRKFSIDDELAELLLDQMPEQLSQQTSNFENAQTGE